MNDQLRILVVEDDLVDSKAVCRMLTRVEEPRQIDTASSMEQAKQKSREGRYDAVILDLGLPDSQGVDSVIEFQASVPEVPIVVVSGTNDEKLALRSLGLGAEDYISKDSITEHGLDRSLRYSIERHRRKTDVYKDLDGLKVLLDNAMAQATSDVLTGLPNRRGLELQLKKLAAARSGHPIIVGIADLEHFKQLSSDQGRRVGDEVLKDFSNRLQHSLRPTDFISYIGGGEFIVLFHQLGRQEGIQLGTRILNHLLRNPAQVGNLIVRFNVSLALTEIEAPTADLNLILQRAHDLIANGKNSAPNQVKHSWQEEAPVPGNLPPSAADLSVPPPLVQFIRSVRPLQASDTLATYLSYGFGADGWRMTAQATAQARLANRLSEMTLDCMRKAQAWRMQNPQMGGLHLDIEADAIQPWARRQMAQIFPDGLTRSSCVLFVNTNFSEQPRNMFLSEILRLKNAGFKIGIRNVGSGATVLEELQQLEPDWLRFDPSLTLHVGRYSSKARTLEKIVDSLKPLKARMIADEIEEDVDLPQLLEFGFDSYYAAPSRPVADLSENVS